MMTAESSIDHAPLNSSLSQIINMELGGPESSSERRAGNLPPSAAALAQARLLAAEEASLSHQAKLAAAAQIMAAQQQSSALHHRHHQLEQLRQLQAMQQLSFLYPPAATPPPLGSSYLMEAILARQHQEQQFLAAVSANAAAAELALAARAPRPEATPPPPPTSSGTDLESSMSSTRDKGVAKAVSPKRAVDKLPEDLVASSKKKQKREPSSSGEGDDDDDDDSKGHRFRPYQYEQWTEKFQELTDFRKEKGHCQVPHTYTENPPLARWVKRQRYQYKLKMENKQSTMTDERVDLLENIGFIWDSHAAAWAEKLHELKEYAELRGDCNVPSTFPDNPQLATWVKCQRRQYKLLRDGKTSNMTVERIKELESIGFVWEVRKSWENTRK